jgi:CubicO group peptidase (beta-lactamase class C family)
MIRPDQSSTTLDRRLFLSAIGAALMSKPARALATPWQWPSAAVAEAGFDPSLPTRLDEAARAGRLPNLHAVLVARGGRLVLERYWAGEDWNRATPLGNVAFGPDTLHDLRSVTKSIVGLLYGQALADRLVPGPDEKLLPHFPQYSDLAADPARARLTVGNVLTMTLGFEWDESVPYTSAANSEIAMELAPDRYRFVLDRPIVTEPGTRWIYTGGATALLARLIERGSGQALPDFARQRLFDPLGIGPTEWFISDDGEAAAASGLRLTPRDLARIGQLVLDGGRWEGRQVVPADWLARSFAPAIAMGEGRAYGYHWYLGRFGSSDKGGWVAAFGNGGQRLYLFPGLDLIVVVTAGNYNRPDQGTPPVTLVRDIVLPSLAAAD